MRKIFGGTDIGLVRATNQDRFATAHISDTVAYGVLCDGMGGENGGHIASELTIQHIAEALSRELINGVSEVTVRGILKSAIAGANARVYETAQKDPSLSGMGTTVIVAVFVENTLYVASVGDSRLYIISPQRECQLTKDHTVVQMLVDIGEITPEDAKVHPKRHFITRAVGVGEAVDMDFFAEELGEQDIVLLCSDGLYHYLAPGQMYALLSACLEGSTVQSLIDLANQSGGADNITAVVAR